MSGIIPIYLHIISLGYHETDNIEMIIDHLLKR